MLVNQIWISLVFDCQKYLLITIRDGAVCQMVQYSHTNVTIKWTKASNCKEILHYFENSDGNN